MPTFIQHPQLNLNRSCEFTKKTTITWFHVLFNSMIFFRKEETKNNVNGKLTYCVQCLTEWINLFSGHWNVCQFIADIPKHSFVRYANLCFRIRGHSFTTKTNFLPGNSPDKPPIQCDSSPGQRTVHFISPVIGFQAPQSPVGIATSS